MNYARLGIYGIGLAVLFWLVTLALRSRVFNLPFSSLAAGLELALLLLGAALFWWWIARRLTQADQAAQRHARRLTALHSAGVAITTEHDLETVLQAVVDQSRILIGARYGALGIVAAPQSAADHAEAHETAIQEFIVSGLDPATESALRPNPPRGHGILGLPITERRAIRVDDIGAHPASVGFPEHHPAMHTFLGVPVVSKNRVYGHLYLTDKLPPPRGQQTATTDATDHTAAQPFSEEDQQILKMFATQAAIAIENANLYRQTRELAVLRERERFGMDLHDGVLQSIYAVGLLLDDGLYHMEGELPTAQERVREATRRLNDVIGDIRRYIHDLRHAPGSETAHAPRAATLRAELEKLAQELRSQSELRVHLDVAPQALRRLTPRQSAELLQIVREAASNAQRHAHATRLEITVAWATANSGATVNHGTTGDAALQLRVRDDGRGFAYPLAQPATGNGLGNMQRRAQAIGATLNITTAPKQGCAIHLHLPLTDPPSADPPSADRPSAHRAETAPRDAGNTP